MKDAFVGRTLGKYEVLEKIGQGGMGKVYRGRQISLNRLVAIKVLPAQMALDEEFVARFRHEARMIASLQHEHIVHVYDIDKTHNADGDALWFIVMELVDGYNLRHRPGTGGAMEPVDVRAIGLALTRALGYAHQRGIVHRDIKSANVMVTREGKVKLMDFGVAKSAGGVKTATGSVLGTPDYMAPEQARSGAATPQTDIYSLGVLLYELATGSLPFRGSDPFQVALLHISQNPVAPRHKEASIPQWLEAIILRALRKDPAQRYGSAAELEAELMAAGEGGEGTTFSAAVPGPPGPLGVGSIATPVDHQARLAGQPYRDQSRSAGSPPALPYAASPYSTSPQTASPPTPFGGPGTDPDAPTVPVSQTPISSPAQAQPPGWHLQQPPATPPSAVPSASLGFPPPLPEEVSAGGAPRSNELSDHFPSAPPGGLATAGRAERPKAWVIVFGLLLLLTAASVIWWALRGASRDGATPAAASSGVELPGVGEEENAAEDLPPEVRVAALEEARRLLAESRFDEAMAALPADAAEAGGESTELLKEIQARREMDVEVVPAPPPPAAPDSEADGPVGRSTASPPTATPARDDEPAAGRRPNAEVASGASRAGSGSAAKDLTEPSKPQLSASQLWLQARQQKEDRHYHSLRQTLDRLLARDPAWAEAREWRSDVDGWIRRQEKNLRDDLEDHLSDLQEAVEDEEIDDLADLWGGYLDPTTRRFLDPLWGKYRKVKISYEISSARVKDSRVDFVVELRVSGRSVRRGPFEQDRTVRWSGALEKKNGVRFLTPLR